MKNGPLSKVRRRPRQARSRAMVEAILESTTRVLKERGYEALTTNHVAERAGISIGSLYQYFPDKGSLLKALHGQHSQDMAQAIQSVLGQKEPAGLRFDIRRLVRAAMAAHESDPEMHRIIEKVLPVFEESEPVGDEVYQHICELIRRNKAEVSLQPSLEIRAWVVMRLVRGLVHAAILEPPLNADLLQLEEEIVTCIFGYLRNDSGE